MKRIFSALLFALIVTTAQAQTLTPPITQSVGSGNNTSYFVLNFDDGPQSTNNPASDYVFAYNWNYGSGDTAPSSTDMIAAYNALTNPTLRIQVVQDPTYGSFVNAISYGPYSQTGYSTSGGYGYWAFYTSDASRLSGNSNDWTYSAVGVDGRTLTPNSYDGFTFATDSATPTPVLPTAGPAAVPEPSAAWLFFLGAGTLGLLAIRRRIA